MDEIEWDTIEFHSHGDSCRIFVPNGKMKTYIEGPELI